MIHGKVIKAFGSPNPHSFNIQGDDKLIYFAHLGDIKFNEDKLYTNAKTETLFLEEGDEVEFDPSQGGLPKAIHIKKQ